jgi:acyl CoA:acetate/3-ketoacid CoA transferase beta subunit
MALVKSDSKTGAKRLKEGYFVNLGIGIPTLVTYSK